jgi:hypothetical protein
LCSLELCIDSSEEFTGLADCSLGLKQAQQCVGRAVPKENRRRFDTSLDA